MLYSAIWTHLDAFFFLGILIELKDNLSQASGDASSTIEMLDQVAAHAESFHQCSPKSKKGLQSSMDTLDREGEYKVVSDTIGTHD